MDNELDNELEKIINEAVNEINRNLYEKPFRGEGNKKEPFIEIYDYGEGYIEFLGPFKHKARSMKELKPLFDYIREKKYRTNLD